MSSHPRLQNLTGPIKDPALVEEVVAEGLRLVGDRSPEEQALFAENIRVQCQYTNEYVVYIDTWDDTQKPARLTRKILGHSTDSLEMSKLIKTLDPELRKEIIFDYQDDPFQ